MVQFAETSALSDMLALALPACAGELDRIPKAPTAATDNILATKRNECFFMTTSPCAIVMAFVCFYTTNPPTIGSEIGSVIRAFFSAAPSRFDEPLLHRPCHADSMAQCAEIQARGIEGGAANGLGAKTCAIASKKLRARAKHAVVIPLAPKERVSVAVSVKERGASSSARPLRCIRQGGRHEG
jgi:hypothetical protein